MKKAGTRPAFFFPEEEITSSLPRELREQPHHQQAPQQEHPHRQQERPEQRLRAPERREPEPERREPEPRQEQEQLLLLSCHRR
jgi:hypothetical protein